MQAPCLRVTASLAAACLSLLTGTSLAAGAGAHPACGSYGNRAAPARLPHVLWIWMENHSADQIIGSSSAPYINQLASQCGLATNYHAVTHPSLPNYIAATSGDYWGIQDDDPPSSHPLSGASLFSQVAAAGLSWRSYEESMPSNCDLSSSGTYAVKHNPAAYYTGIRTDCANWDVPMGTTSSGSFLSDLQNDTVPAFSFVTPNLCNDMHDCSVSTGDSWLQSWVPKILASPGYTSGNTVLVVTWDEGTSSSNQVATLVVSPTTPAGTKSSTAFSHYALLKTTEQLLGISTYLAHAGDAATQSMRSAFHL
jgi:phospholipase C